MKTCLLTLAAILAVGLGLSITPACAQDESECLQDLTDCFKFEGEARAGCFRRGARSASCLHTEQGRLALRRGAISGTEGEANNDLLATPEPSIVNNDCLDNFDSFWLGNLVNGPISSDTLANLNEMLEGCSRTATHDLLRP
jgi:hypothetical protein